MQIVILIYPNMTQLDFTGPFEVLSAFPGSDVALAWKDREPVRDGNGLTVIPSTSFADCPKADILLVPGGFGQAALMDDDEVLDWLRDQAEGADYVTSVCTGSLVLAAAGLLSGYRATSHWAWLDHLELFGVEPVSERVVVDGNRVTAAGVSSGIDMALSLAAEIYGETVARMIQLAIEYDPSPPFDGGHPRRETEEVVGAVMARLAGFAEARREVSEKAAARLKEKERPVS